MPANQLGQQDEGNDVEIFIFITDELPCFQDQDEGIVHTSMENRVLQKHEEEDDEDLFWNDLEVFVSSLDANQSFVEVYKDQQDVEIGKGVKVQVSIDLFEEFPLFFNDEVESIVVLTSISSFQQHGDDNHLDKVQIQQEIKEGSYVLDSQKVDLQQNYSLTKQGEEQGLAFEGMCFESHHKVEVEPIVEE